MRPYRPAASVSRQNFLVEANAGTGKTYTLTSIYVQLLASGAARSSEVVLVTFTRKAAAELKDAVAIRLQQWEQALTAMLAPDSSCAYQAPDETFELVVQDSAPEAILARVRAARRASDQAPILTIHGFCQRILGEYAFSIGHDRGARLSEIEPDEVSRVMRDVWHDLQSNLDRESLQVLDLFGINLSNWPDLLELPWRQYEVPLPDSAQQPQRWEKAKNRFAQRASALLVAIREIAEIWADQKDHIISLIEESGLNKQTWNSKLKRELWADLNASITGSLDWVGAPRWKKLTQAALDSKLKKNAARIEHPLFAAVSELEALVEAIESDIPLIRASLVDQGRSAVSDQYAADQLSRRAISFNALITNVLTALRSDIGPKIAEQIKQRYPMAMVDEFQDTDLGQFEIFQRIYGNPGPWMMVGDPKQSIYQFRGADIFAYLTARELSADQFGLHANWRSRAALVDVVNNLFSQSPTPFVLENLEYAPSTAARSDLPKLHVGKNSDALEEPLVHLLDSQSSRVELRRESVAKLAANRIGYLLRRDHHWDDRPVTPEDVLVLVRTNAQSELVASELMRLGIPFSRISKQSVFATDVASALVLVARAVAHPRRSDYVAAAMVSGLSDWQSSDFKEWLTNEDRQLEALSVFSQASVIGAMHGMVAALVWLLDKWSTWQRSAKEELASHQSNLMHMLELLSAELDSTRGTLAQAWQWLARQVASAPDAAKDNAVRTVNARGSVQIMTIHQAKGLQARVVLLPFLWDYTPPKKAQKWGLIHADKTPYQPSLEWLPTMTESQRNRFVQEALSEDMRLLYVALTRAECHMEIFWETSKPGDHTPLARLLGEPCDPAVWEASGLAVANQNWCGEAAISAGGIEIRTVQPLTPPKTPVPAWSQTSFSALVEEHSPESVVSAPDEVQNIEPIFALPAGPAMGNLIHGILEHLPSFQVEQDELSRRVARACAEADIGEPWIRVLTDQLSTLLDTPLFGDAALRDIPSEDSIAELAFDLQCAKLDVRALAKVINATALRSDFWSSTGAYLRGFVDLIVRVDGRYYVVDYKSNHLGNQLDDYHPDKLVEVMSKAGYDLQYHLYLLALHRLLRGNDSNYDPYRHLGGAIYLFVRGMRPGDADNFGVFRDSQCIERVLALDELLSE